jgi:flagellar motility protein MotE (MotC chaperone)
MAFRLRVLPVAILGAGLLLSVKVGVLSNDAGRVLDELTVGPSHAGSVEDGPVADGGETPMAGDGPLADGGERPEEDGGGGKDAVGFGLEDEDFDPMMFSRAEIELLQNLSERRAELERREREIELRESTMAAAEETVVQKLGELRELQATVEALVVQYDEQQEKRLRNLVKIYESMKPKDAAPIFANLDNEILLDVIERMREAKAAPILALLDPEQAQQITIDLADRHQPPDGRWQ